MTQLITVDYPEDLALSLNMKNQEFKQEMKTISIVKLYEMGKISSGAAARLLNINRVDFLEILGKYKASQFYPGYENELESDVRNA